MASLSWFRVSSLEKISQPPHCLLIRHADGQRLAGARVAAGGSPGAPLDKADRHREGRTLSAVGQTGHAEGLAEPDACFENGLGRIGGAHQSRAATGDDHSRREEAVEAAL